MDELWSSGSRDVVPVETKWDSNPNTSGNQHGHTVKRYGAWYMPPEEWRIIYKPGTEDNETLLTKLGAVSLNEIKRRNELNERKSSLHSELESSYTVKAYREFVREKKLPEPRVIAKVPTPSKEKMLRAVRLRQAALVASMEIENTHVVDRGRSAYGAQQYVTTLRPGGLTADDLDVDEVLRPEYRDQIHRAVEATDRIMEHLQFVTKMEEQRKVKEEEWERVTKERLAAVAACVADRKSHRGTNRPWTGTSQGHPSSPIVGSILSITPSGVDEAVFKQVELEGQEQGRSLKTSPSGWFPDLSRLHARIAEEFGQAGTVDGEAVRRNVVEGVGTGHGYDEEDGDEDEGYEGPDVRSIDLISASPSGGDVVVATLGKQDVGSVDGPRHSTVALQASDSPASVATHLLRSVEDLASSVPPMGLKVDIPEGDATPFSHLSTAVLNPEQENDVRRVEGRQRSVRIADDSITPAGYSSTVRTPDPQQVPTLNFQKGEQLLSLLAKVDASPPRSRVYTLGEELKVFEELADRTDVPLGVKYLSAVRVGAVPDEPLDPHHTVNQLTPGIQSLSPEANLHYLRKGVTGEKEDRKKWKHATIPEVHAGVVASSVAASGMFEIESPSSEPLRRSQERRVGGGWSLLPGTITSKTPSCLKQSVGAATNSNAQQAVPSALQTFKTSSSKGDALARDIWTPGSTVRAGDLDPILEAEYEMDHDDTSVDSESPLVKPWYEGEVSPASSANLSIAWISKDRVSMATRMQMLNSRQGSRGTSSALQEGRRSISTQERKSVDISIRVTRTAGSSWDRSMMGLRSGLHPATAPDVLLSKSYISSFKSALVTASTPHFSHVPALAMLGPYARPHTAGVEVSKASSLSGLYAATRLDYSKGSDKPALLDSRFSTPPERMVLVVPHNRTSVSAGGNRLPPAYKPRIVNKPSR
ncbi:hypothetical protein CEUSTIGMA_g13014.t1 [Chlamydomonas eustigma]|uniref:Uncharacterized protein n=1 Tax=Chlamydomonas eustigma TaxID=1157962 RepID=A0A250XRM3_9CHLO|nr:hypothetical protein CEUSTIGMA_g13014.t1 [Chlamydomonas eustigma]|eukprot:GAX85599.1 hypothetical protein CEUSTIGMA_g13014.t1 [Chlamydomonas eustigma]